MTALDTLASEIGTSGRTLRRAASRGLVRTERRSPHRVRVDYREQEWVRRRWPLVAKLVQALRTEPNVRAAALYGSVARGTDVEGLSDVDLLVSLREDSFRSAVDLEERLAHRLGSDVHVLRLSRAQDDPEFLLGALADARPLVDREGEWARLQRQQRRLQSDAGRRRAERRARVRRKLAALEQ